MTKAQLERVCVAARKAAHKLAAHDAAHGRYDARPAAFRWASDVADATMDQRGIIATVYQRAYSARHPESCRRFYSRRPNVNTCRRTAASWA